MLKCISLTNVRVVVCLTLFLLLLTSSYIFFRHRSVAPQAFPALRSDEAVQFLEKSGQAGSLLNTLNEQRFKVSWKEASPFGDKSNGYLALSHEQNLNAWFTKEGVTIRPTGPEVNDSWKFGMKLKAYGYGDQLVPPGDVVDFSVNGIRVEYQRQSKILEWYENRSAGIEQGFTLNERPRSEQSSLEPLKLFLSISGGLKASVNEKNDEIKLTNSDGKAIVSYRQLSAVDANSQKLPAHLETSKEGNEIVIVVDDSEATYPIVIDPITASEQARLIPGVVENGGRIGFSVAIDGFLAIIGSPTTDLDIFTADVGRVYVYSSNGTTWTPENSFSHPTLGTASLRCGYSVDVSRALLVYGCPGFAGTKGSSVVLFRSGPGTYTTTIIDHPQIHPGDRFGAYVSVDGVKVLVGAPFYDRNSAQDTNDGAAFLFEVDGTQVLSSTVIEGEGTPFTNNMFGSDVAIDNNGATFVVGEPQADVSTISNTGAVHVFSLQANGTYARQTLTASDLAAEDQFGQTVAISGNTIVVGSPFDDNQKGTNAGSVYVFRRRNSGTWIQEAKLVASDGFANDEFSFFGLAIKNSTVVVGSHLADGPNFPFDPTDNRGEVYIYTPENEVWTEQFRIRASDGSPGDEFGLGVDLDPDTLIVGAPNDDLVFPGIGTLFDAGSAYVYSLSCASVPLPGISISVGDTLAADSIDLCTGTKPALAANTGEGLIDTYQWRRNGVNIPGETGQLLLKVFTAADAGTYDVVVSNSCSSRISPPVVVNVNSGCNVSPLSQNLPNAPGNGSLNVTACPTCYWSVTQFVNSTSAGFSLVNSGGRGNGSLNFTVSQNPFTSSRSIEYEIAGKRALITQDPSPHFFVTDDDSTTNTGGSLASVINKANQTPGDDLITFNIPGAGPHTISLSSTLQINSNIKIINDRIGDESVTVRRNTLIGDFRLFQLGPTANVSISGLTISGGKLGPEEGPAILNDRGRLSLRDCTISNHFSDLGAPVQNNGGTVEVDSCTFMNNMGFAGGGLGNSTINGPAVMIINNSTFSGNQTGFRGGAIYNGLETVPGHLVIRNSTLTNNTSINGASVYNNGVLTTINTIYRKSSTAKSIVNNGSIISLGHNLSDDPADGNSGTAPGGLLNGAGDIRNTNPNLGPLTNNGGPTITHALIAPSAAIDAGDNGVSSAPYNLLTEQRGFLRRMGTNIDIGAFESGATAGPAVQFSATNYTGGEAGSRIDLVITRTGASSIPVNVSYATSDKGSGNSCDAVSDFASSRCDYLRALGTIRLNPGETSQIISILVIDDVIPENSEKLSIEITEVKGARMGPQNTAEVTITDNETTNLPSPLSQPIFFVREHYLDFLNREPDAGGLNFWTNEITSCGANAQCVEVKRINVSAAFFLSIEFQETGYLVYRSYKSAFGNLPSRPVPIGLNDFLRDTQEIGKSVVVGSPGWEAQLESNKQAYSLAFVNRPEFIRSFANTLTADQFVTQMNNNAGGVLSATEKANLVALLAPNPFDATRRAQVLRAVAEDADLRNAEFNKAFVLMQYFGYLRRNPDDLPDTNFDGFNFWLTKLNQFNGNYINAEMVKAFIQSIEFGRRFAP